MKSTNMYDLALWLSGFFGLGALSAAAFVFAAVTAIAQPALPVKDKAAQMKSHEAMSQREEKQMKSEKAKLKANNTVAGTDSRTVVVMQSRERDLFLSQMRDFLSAVQGILEGANQGDMNRIVQSSRSAGMAARGDVSPSLIAKLPSAWKALGMSMHRDMDEIANAAEGGKPAPELLKMTVKALEKCAACHASYQVRVGK